MPVINPQKALVLPQIQKKFSRIDCQSPTPTSQNLPFGLGTMYIYILKVRIADFSL
jgi:hypothetical protein